MAGAVLGAAVLVAAPAASAATCVPVPGSTIGTDLSVAGQKVRVPAISGITVCAGGATVPLVSVQTSGGTCTFGCLSVLVGGGAIDAEGLSVSYREDGVLRTVPVNPPPVPGADSTCVLSVGSPDAPYPDCFIAVGPELGDPIGDLDPVVDGAVGTVLGVAGAVLAIAGDAAADALALAGEVANDAVPLVLGLVETAREIADNADEMACDRIPPAYDRRGNERDFCYDPQAWAYAVRDTVVDTVPQVPGCESVPDVYEPDGYPRSFCDSPTLWAGAVVRSVQAYCDAGNCSVAGIRCVVMGLAGDPCW